MSRLNIILFGATGFTGRATIPALYKLAGGSNLSWGIAGRSYEKLENVLKVEGEKLGVNLSSTPIMIADACNEKSLNEMVTKAQVIINMCGPFRFYGEPIVKACITNGTHYLDISGEPQFIETIELKYAEEAAKNKCYIISSCGFDCIPSDLGVVFMQKNFKGTLNSIEAHLQTSYIGKGPYINYATWESAVYGFADYETLIEIRRVLSKRRTKIPPKQINEKKPTIFRNDLTGQWSVPFPGADTSIVKRSQQYFYEKNYKHPIKFDMYFCVDSVTSIIKYMFSYMAVSKLCHSEEGKQLLLKHLELFSHGVFGHDIPSEEERKETRATIYMKGTGCLDIHANQPNTTRKDHIVGCISTNDPAYGNTGVIVTLAAITLLEEMNKLPNNGNGGVFTPAAVFSNTSLISRLNRNGITFKIISKL